MKKRMMTVAAMALGIAMLSAGPASATGGPCNGRVDYNCTDTTNGYNCTVYVAALHGCQIGA